MDWKPLFGFEEVYSISNHGNIKRNNTDRILINSHDKDGYENIGLRKLGDRKKYWFRIHRLVAYAFCTPPDNWMNLHVDHIDRNISNNHEDNLRWVTSEINNLNRKQTHWNTNKTTRELYISKANSGFLVRFRKRSLNHTSYHRTLESAIITRDSLLSCAVEHLR